MTTTTTIPAARTSHDSVATISPEETWTTVLCGEDVVYATPADEIPAVDAHEANCAECKRQAAILDRH